MQHNVVGCVGVTSPVGTPPSAGHDAVPSVGGAARLMPPGSPGLPHVVGTVSMFPEPTPGRIVALHATFGAPQRHCVHVRPSVAEP